MMASETAIAFGMTIDAAERFGRDTERMRMIDRVDAMHKAYDEMLDAGDKFDGSYERARDRFWQIKNGAAS